MARKRVHRFTVIDEVVAQLEEAITSGEYPRGSKLPGESELAGELSVSRPIVREALARLRERGYVRTVNGRGTYVRESGLDSAAEALLRQVRLHIGTEIPIDDLYDVRRTIELRTVGLAAEHASAEHLDALEQHVAAMKKSSDVDAEAYATADAAFHLTLAESSANPLYPLLLSPIVDLIVKSIYQTVKSSADRMQSGIDDHERIIECIRARDAEAAVREIGEHLVRSRAMHSASAVEIRNQRDDWPRAVRLY